MTSNLTVAGTAVKTEPQVARGAFGVGLGGEVSTVGAERDFASVLAEVMSSARSSSAASVESARAGESMSPSMSPSLAEPKAGLPAGDRLERALISEDAARWVAAPMVYRAIDAYRELMNVSA